MGKRLLHVIAEPYRRLRHSRGFGVHSPWAYALIRQAIMPQKHGYYADPWLKKLFGRDAAAAQMVMRILLHLGAGTVTAVGDSRWQQLAFLVQRPGGVPVLLLAEDKSDTPKGRGASNAPGAFDFERHAFAVFANLDTAAGRRDWHRALENPHATMAVDTCRRIGVVAFGQGLPRQTITLKSLFNDQ